MPDIAPIMGTSIDSLTKEFNIIANNLANASTAGFKRRCTAFSDSLKALENEGQTSSEEKTEQKWALDFSQGGLVQTGQPLDLALYGKGFFVIETPDGPLYTRNGNFSINKNSQIVDSSGNIVAGESGPITVTNNTGSQLTIENDGNIKIGKASVGKFKLLDFKNNEDKLVPVGQSCFKMTDPTVIPVTAQNLVVKQGYQESSNVRMVEELVNMITVSRIYEANMKFMSASSDAVNNLMNVAMG
jgi:flagellar basal-body rod protein FlgF